MGATERSAALIERFILTKRAAHLDALLAATAPRAQLPAAPKRPAAEAVCELVALLRNDVARALHGADARAFEDSERARSAATPPAAVDAAADAAAVAVCALLAAPREASLVPLGALLFPLDAQDFGALFARAAAQSAADATLLQSLQLDAGVAQALRVRAAGDANAAHTAYAAKLHFLETRLARCAAAAAVPAAATAAEAAIAEAAVAAETLAAAAVVLRDAAALWTAEFGSGARQFALRALQQLCAAAGARLAPLALWKRLQTAPPLPSAAAEELVFLALLSAPLLTLTPRGVRDVLDLVAQCPLARVRRCAQYVLSLLLAQLIELLRELGVPAAECDGAAASAARLTAALAAAARQQSEWCEAALQPARANSAPQRPAAWCDLTFCVVEGAYALLAELRSDAGELPELAALLRRLRGATLECVARGVEADLRAGAVPRAFASQLLRSAPPAAKSAAVLPTLAGLHECKKLVNDFTNLMFVSPAYCGALARAIHRCEPRRRHDVEKFIAEKIAPINVPHDKVDSACGTALFSAKNKYFFQTETK